MEEATASDDPNEASAPEPSPAAPLVASGAVPALGAEQRRPEVEAELAAWYGQDQAQQLATLRREVQGDRTLSFEALIHVNRQAFKRDDRTMFNLAFEALSKAATPLLVSQARDLAHDERHEQAQTVLLEIFALIRTDDVDFLEVSFLTFANRRAVDLFRKRKARFEGKNQRIEPTEDADPLDALPARLPSAEALALLSVALAKLSPKHRAAFIQHHYFGLTYEEIAAHHKVTVRSIQNWLKTANEAIGLSGDHNDA